MSVSAAVLGRALGEEGFHALQRELGELPEYRMTEAQADAVVRLQLGQLAALERDEILREFQGLRGDINSYETLLSDNRNILALVREDLVHLRDKHADKRRTEITGEEARLNREDLIEEAQMAVTLSHQGYIKRMPLDTFRTQNRGGRGVSGGTTREEDFIEQFFSASTHAYLLCFTNRGQVYWLKVYDIPEGSRTSQGRSIANVLSLREGEKIESLFAVRDFAALKDHSLIIATKNGVVKKTPLEEYSRPRANGIIAVNLREEDALIGVVLVKEGDEVMLANCSRSARTATASEPPSVRIPPGARPRAATGRRPRRRRRRPLNPAMARSRPPLPPCAIACSAGVARASGTSRPRGATAR